MSPEELRNLKPGDIVRSHFDAARYVVTENYGCRVTAVRTVDPTNESEWHLVVKVVETRFHPDEG